MVSRMRRLGWVGVAVLATQSWSVRGADCNRNGLEDVRELAANASLDCNGNGLPDDCDLEPVHLGFHRAAVLPSFYSVLAVDIDGDGRLDLAGTSSCPDQKVFTLLNTGHASFRQEDLPLGYCGAGIAGGDFDRDGDVDLAVERRPRGSLRILLRGAGGYSEAAIVPGDGVLAAADLDADGVADLVTVSAGRLELGFHVSRGDGAFSDPLPIILTEFPVAAAVSDLDADGALDLAVALHPQAAFSPGEVQVLLGHPRGRPSVESKFTLLDESAAA